MNESRGAALKRRSLLPRLDHGDFELAMTHVAEDIVCDAPSTLRRR